MDDQTCRLSSISTGVRQHSQTRNVHYTCYGHIPGGSDNGTDVSSTFKPNSNIQCPKRIHVLFQNNALTVFRISFYDLLEKKTENATDSTSFSTKISQIRLTKK